MPQSEQIPNWLDSTGAPVPRMPDGIHVATVGIMFNDRGEVLLQRRADNGHWALPGGFVDVGESVAEGAVREVFEETGLRTTIKRLVGIYSDPRHHTIMQHRSGRIYHMVIIAFECEVQSGELKISHESTDIGYFPTDALPEKTILSHPIRIQDALANRVEPFVR
jgi:ADP-ribose pyrophosphatase YjhB (NUDIX family)